MNETPKNADQLKVLSVHYAQQLPSKLGDLERSLEHLVRNPSYAEALITFHRQAHTLTGSGASFGFPRLSQCARELETYLKSCQAAHRPLGAQDFETMRNLLQAIKQSAASPEPEPNTAPIVQATLDPEAESPLLYILDDDANTLNFLSKQLGNLGYQVRVFTAPDALSASLVSERPSAMLLDVVLGQGVTGPQVAQSLPDEIKTRIPIVYFSEHTDFATRLECARAGGEAYFVKPANIDLLADTLDQITRRVMPQPFRVLIVDDAEADAVRYATTLESVGMITRTIADPAQVMETLEDFNAELILMNMSMPGVRGDELAKVIRQQSAYVSIPIVFLSAETDMDKQMAAIRFGGDDFLAKPINLQHLVSAVTSRVERYRTLCGLMQRDSLTGLLNHTKSKEYLEAELARAQRMQQPVSFAMIDIDHFKKVNDTYGYPMGDRVIQSLARLLQQRLRKTDAIGRYGGEEFAVIMPNTPAHTAFKVLDALRAAFSQIQHHANDKKFAITFSCGVAEASANMQASDLTEIAVRALYQAKHGGRNRVTKASS